MSIKQIFSKTNVFDFISHVRKIPVEKKIMKTERHHSFPFLVAKILVCNKSCMVKLLMTKK